VSSRLDSANIRVAATKRAPEGDAIVGSTKLRSPNAGGHIGSSRSGALKAGRIRVAITPEPYDAIERTLALGTVACEPQPDENGSA
jgi:hypothetical protein